MKYFSIDIETTGLDPEKHQILSISIVFEDTNNIVHIDKLPKLNIYFKHDEIHGQPIALKMNRDLMDFIQSSGRYNEDEAFNCESFFLKGREYKKASEIFKDFVKKCVGENVSTINVAGKNLLAFDIPFLNSINFFDLVKYHRRVIDPAILSANWIKRDTLPNLQDCLEYKGLDFVGNPHESVWDAINVIRVLRKEYEPSPIDLIVLP